MENLVDQIPVTSLQVFLDIDENPYGVIVKLIKSSC